MFRRLTQVKMLAAHNQPCCPPTRAAGSSRPARRRLPAPLSATKKSFPSFEAMLAESEVPVLVDFYALWCALLRAERPSHTGP